MQCSIVGISPLTIQCPAYLSSMAPSTAGWNLQIYLPLSFCCFPPDHTFSIFLHLFVCLSLDLFPSPHCSLKIMQKFKQLLKCIMYILKDVNLKWMDSQAILRNQWTKFSYHHTSGGSILIVTCLLVPLIPPDFIRIVQIF